VKSKALLARAGLSYVDLDLVKFPFENREGWATPQGTVSVGATTERRGGVFYIQKLSFRTGLSR